MTEQFSIGPRQSLSSLDGGGAPGLSAQARARPGRPDPFTLSVATCGLDMLLLHATPQTGTAQEAFQILLRAMCASGRKVERAGLQDGHISLMVGGVALAFGPDRLPDRRSGVFYRPDRGARPCGAARLGFFLYRHQACTRLRIAAGARLDLVRELLILVLRSAPPKAVVLMGSRIVLSRAEVMNVAPPDLAGLSPAQPVPRPVARYVRPKIAGSAAPPSAFTPQISAPRAMPLDAMIAGSAALREQARLRAALRPHDAAQGPGARRWRRAVALGLLMLSLLTWVVGHRASEAGGLPF